MKVKLIELLNKMSNDETYIPICIKFYNDLFVWNDLYKDWLNNNGEGLLKYNFPQTLNNEIEVIK